MSHHRSQPSRFGGPVFAGGVQGPRFPDPSIRHNSDPQKFTICMFCKSNKEHPVFYTSHTLKDDSVSA